MKNAKNLIIGVVVGAIIAVLGIQAFADPLGIKDDKTEENVAKHENHIDDDDEFDGDDDFDDSELGEQGVQEDGKPVSGISTSRAMKIALEKVGGGHVTDIERDWEGGRYIYHSRPHRVSLKSEYDVWKGFERSIHQTTDRKSVV